MLVCLLNLPNDKLSYEDYSSSIIETLKGCKIVKFNAKEFSNKDIKLDMSWHLEKYGFSLSNTEVLIYNAHYNIWKHFKDQDEEWCMVIDNSVKLEYSPNFNMIEKELRKTDWDIFFPYEYSDTSRNALAKKKILNNNIRENADYEPYLLGRKWGNSIYFIRKDGINKLLSIEFISQNVEDEILLLSMENNLNVYCRRNSWFKYENQIEILNHDRENEILKSIHSINVWSYDNLFKIRKLLAILSHVSLTLKIDLVLQGGTHLGYVRHGGLMPWDDDVDLGIEEKSTESFFKVLKEYPNIELGIFVEPRTNKPYYKVWFRNGQDIEGYSYKFPFVDIWMYNIVGKDLIFLNGIICPNSASKDFIKVIFEKSTFKIPHNSLECLDTRYKDWRTTIRVYSWSHRNEKIGFHRLKTKISVNKEGKLVEYLSKNLNNI